MENSELSESQRRLAERCEKEADSTSKAALAWIVSLLLILLAIVNSLVPKLHDIRRIEARWENAEDDSRLDTQSRAPLGGSDSGAEARKKADQEREAIRARQRSTTKQYIDLSKDLGSIPTPLGVVTLPARYLPLMWLGLACGLLFFLSARRRRLLKKLSEAVAVKRQYSSEPLELVAPIWCAPLPRVVHLDKQGTQVTRQELAHGIGWAEADGARSIVIVGLAAILALCWIWLASDAEVLSRFENDPLVRLKTGVLLDVLSLMAAAIGAHWLLNLGWTPWLSHPRIPGRRAWLRTAALSTGGLAVYFAAPRWALPGILRRDQPRLKIKHQQPPAPEQFRGAFWIHPKSQNIHYIGKDGWHSEGSQLHYAGLTAISRDAVVAVIASEPRNGASPRVPRILESQRHGVTECLALQLVIDGKKDAGFDLLVKSLALGQGRGNLRLIDLALRIGSADAAQLDELRKARARISESGRPPRTDARRSQWNTTFGKARGYTGLVDVDRLRQVSI